jgi:hypothetical protein
MRPWRSVHRFAAGNTADVQRLIAEEVDECVAHMEPDIARASRGIDGHDFSLSSRQGLLSRRVVESTRRGNDDCRMAGAVRGDDAAHAVIVRTLRLGLRVGVVSSSLSPWALQVVYPGEAVSQSVRVPPTLAARSLRRSLQRPQYYSSHAVKVTLRCG